MSNFQGGQPPPNDPNLNASPASSEPREPIRPAPMQDSLGGADTRPVSDGSSTRGGSHSDSLVDDLNREYLTNPAQGDAPPPDEVSEQPVWDDIGEDEAGEVRRGGFGRAVAFFTAPPAAKADKGAVKRKAPKSAAARRRAVVEAERRQRRSVRYAGDRKKWWMLQAALVAAAVASLLALGVAGSKPSAADIDVAVEKALTSSGRDFPRGDSVMWAGQALRVWGTWDEAQAENRKVLLAPYLSSGMDPQGGWNGEGTQQLLFATLNPDPTVIDANHALIQANYQVQDASWRCVTVPVYAYRPPELGADGPWAFALSGNPTPSGCNPRTGAPAITDAENEGLVADPTLGRELAADFFPGFFSAWAASDSNTLQQYTAAGTQTLGLGGAMTSVPPPTIGEAAVMIPSQGDIVDGNVYAATVPVTWTVAGTTSQIAATYEVGVKRDKDRWYVVSEPVASSQSPEAGGGQPGQVPGPGADASAEGIYPSTGPTPTPPPSAVTPRDDSPNTGGQ